jgi:predicted nucleotidyltransferase
VSVLSFLSNTAAKSVLSQNEQMSISTSIATLQARLEQHFAYGVIKQHFRFGSSTRGTILPRSMDEQSDIDYMIVFNENNATPQTYLNRIKAFVEKYYRTSEIRQSSPTIVLELNHIKFDLVPATSTWFGDLQIPNGSGGWMDTNPNSFNSTLEAKNRDHQSLIKPTIRLFKYWNATAGFPFPSSFEMEKWVCDLTFWWPTNQKDYFLTVIENLSTSYMYSQWVNSEITRARAIVSNVRKAERNSASNIAEQEIRHLFRLQKLSTWSL